MSLDELNNLPQPTTDWPSLDHSLLGDSRPTPPAFPLHLLPGRWRTWVEAGWRVSGLPGPTPSVPAAYRGCWFLAVSS